MAPQNKNNTTKISKNVETDLLIEMDPSAPATVARIAFAAESIINLMMGIPMIINPRAALRGDALPFVEQAGDLLQQEPSPEALSLVQYLGAFTLALNAGLWLGLPHRPGAVETRRAAWSMLVGLEVVYVAVVLWQIFVGGETATGVIREKAIRISVIPMSTACLLRLWAMIWKPQSLGRYIVKRKD
ncbi:hypothetical protein DHEL01_v213108 [Diaporthe helianthi]|uniref:Uncharacterized protein n=1 Tax=Diaporthe helianthi TaxID=158607 RepID=A0A2P5HE15_DIAHE|nr:hypothetical protein DHEL01_v213108 [Diaporthe helianthi]